MPRVNCVEVSVSLGSTSERAGAEQAIDFEGGVAARVEDLARKELFDLEHGAGIITKEREAQPRHSLCTGTSANFLWRRV